MSAVVAAAIDIAVQQTADTVVGSSTGPYLHEVPGGVIPLHGVPLRLRQARSCHRKVVGTVCLLCAVGCELTCSGSRGVVGLVLREFGAICHGIIDGTVQAPGFYLQAVEGQFQTVLDFSALHVAALCVLCRSAADAALVGSIQPVLCRHVGIVAAAHHFVIDDDGGIKHHVVLAFIGHAAHVAAQEEAANVGGIGYVILAVIKQFFFEGERRPQVHCSPFHVFGKYGGVCQIKGSVVVCGVELQPFGTHHVFTIVAQEDVVGNDMRAHLQLHERVLVEVDMCRIHLQRGTVTAAVDGTTYDGGMLGILSSHHDGHLLGIGANGIQCIQRARIVQVAIDIMVYVIFFISIWICPVASAVDVAADAGRHADGIAEIDLAADVVAAIDVVNIAATDEQTGGQVAREEVVARDVVDVIHVHRVSATDGTALQRSHVGHAAAAIYVIHDDGGAFGYLQEQTVVVGHVALVAAAVEVAHLAALQVPAGMDGHLGHVVAAKEPAYLELVAAGMREACVDAHVLEASGEEQVLVAVRHCGRVFIIGCIGGSTRLHSCCCIDQDVARHLAGVGYMDDVLFPHGGVVAAAVGVVDGAALDVEVGPGDFGLDEAGLAGGGDDAGLQFS